jgi:hypothetical protein
VRRLCDDGADAIISMPRRGSSRLGKGLSFRFTLWGSEGRRLDHAEPLSSKGLAIRTPYWPPAGLPLVHPACMGREWAGAATRAKHLDRWRTRTVEVTAVSA